MPLYLVPTPLGNLADITLRAVRVLREAALIIAEDTRTAKRLLHALEIPVPALRAFHAHSDVQSIVAAIEPARDATVAYISDAGMPGISDPGSELVRAARAAEIPVEVLPGPCAFPGAAVLSGFAVAGMSFHGFSPRTSGERNRIFSAAAKATGIGIWYESPHRIIDTLTAISKVAPTARVFVLREYTKRFEEQLLGTAADIAARLAQPVRGEITFVLEPVAVEPVAPPAHDVTDAAIDAGLIAGESAPRLAKRLAAEGHGERSQIYRRIGERGQIAERKDADERGKHSAEKTTLDPA